MQAAQVLPGSPNSSACVSIGSYDGVLYLAFGAGNDVVLTIAHTFSFLQLLQEHKDRITAVQWAKSGGRLASASMGLVVVSIPAPQRGNKPHEWHPALTLKPTGAIESLSWSFRGDLLSTAGAHLAVWYFETSSTGLLQYDSQPFWMLKSHYPDAKISPDGRLVACLTAKRLPLVWTRVGQLNTDGSFPRLNPDAMESIQLDARDPVVSFEWKGMPIYTLYLNKYNPNVLLLVTSRGQVRVYSEFYSPKGIGFNVVFQRQDTGLQAAWLRSFENLENQTVLVAQKQDYLRRQYGTSEFSIRAYSSLVQSAKAEPDLTSYGFISKENGRVEWFLTFLGQEVEIFICEGLGGFPPRAVAVRSFMKYEQYYSPEALRWIPKQYPLFVIREEEEVIIIGRDEMGDFVRWRKHYEKVEYGGYSSSLTAVSGGHRAAILQLEPHGHLPILASVDSSGLVRVWNASLSMTGDQSAMDVLRHWGTIDESDQACVKWTKSFALLVSCSFAGKMTLWQWSSDSANKLKLPSMLWREGVTWQVDRTISRLETGPVRLLGDADFAFEVAGLSPELTIWTVLYRNRKFSTQLLLTRPGDFLDFYIVDIDTARSTYALLLLTKRRLVRTTESGETWSIDFEHDCHRLQVSGIISVSTNHGLLFLGLDGVMLGSLGSRYEGESLAAFISREQVIESLALVQGSHFTIYAQQYLKAVGEQALAWERVLQMDLAFPVTCLAQTLFFQLVLSSDVTLTVFSPEVEHGNFFHFLASFQEPLPLYSPTYLLEFIRLGEYPVVEKILRALGMSLDRGQVSRTLKLTFPDLFEAPKTAAVPPSAPPSDMDWFFDAPQSPTTPMTSSASVLSGGLSQRDASELKEKILDLSNQLPTVSGDFLQLRKLEELINCCVRICEQGRTLDDFATVFSVHISLLRLQPEYEKKGLSTMEVAWALHSEQQDTLFQLCFPGDLTWSEMRVYGMGLWVQSLSRLKTMVENVARSTFRATKDAKSVLLWYLALNKKAILVGLLKSDTDNQKIYEFIRNDFSTERWQVAAQKNAFELRKQRKYEMCAGFFLLANKLINAAEIMARDMGDVQLALVVCRLVEGDFGPAYQQIVEKFILTAGKEAQDPWATSIGHTLLKQHTESLECLSFVPDAKAPLRTELWAEECQPRLTGFHPCVVTFVRLLKGTMKVKHDAQKKGIALVKHDAILQAVSSRSAKAYMRTGLPLLSLFILSQVTHEDKEALGDACCVHLQAVIADTAETEWKQELPTLCSVIADMTGRFHLTPTLLNDYVAQIFHKRGLSHFQSAFLSGLKQPAKSAEIVLNRAAIVHIVLSRVSRDMKFLCKPGTLKNLTTELIQCLSLLWPTSRSLTALPVMERSSLMAIVLSIYLAAVMSGYMRNQWREAALVLKSLEEQLADQSFPFYTALELSTASKEDEGDLLHCWFKYLLVKKLTSLMASFNFKQIDDYLDQELNEFNLLDRVSAKGHPDSPNQAIQRALGPGRGRKKRPLMPVSRLLRRVESWGRRLGMRMNKLISNMTIQATQQALELLTRQQEELPEGLAVHFRSKAEYELFCQVVNSKAELHYLLIASSKSISNFIYENAGKVAGSIDKEGFIYEESVRENADLFGSGVELYRGKDPILGFAINCCDKRSLVLACESSKSKGLRDVNIENSLKYDRRNEKLLLTDEDSPALTEDAYMFNQTIMAALGSLYDTKKRVFEEKVKLPPNRWHGIDLDSLISQLSGHKDYTEHVRTICSHPMLPLFVTGNKSGVVTLWQYDRTNSLNDFATATARAMVKYLEFNEYGDKMGACDAQGNFFLYRFDLQPTSFHPQLSLMASMGNQTRAFAFLNLGSIVATIGHKPRAFMSIYDTLLPPRSSLLHSDSVGGCTVNYLSKYQQLLIGGKKGKLVVYDLRKQETVTTIDTAQGSLKGVVTDSSELTFATGGLGSGVVKIWDARTLQLRDSVEAAKGKAGISALRFMGTALFSASTDGSFKLLRTTTH